MTNDDEAVPGKDAGGHRSGRWSRAAGGSGQRSGAERSPERSERERESQAPRRDDRGRESQAPRRDDRGRADDPREDRRRDDRRREGEAPRSFESRGRGGGARGRTGDGGRRDERPAYGRGPREDRGRDGRPGGSSADRGRGRSGAAGGRDRDDRRGPRREERGGAPREDRGTGGDQAPRGPRSWDRSSPSKKSTRDTRVEPPLPEEITGKELDRSVWREMRTLTKENAQGVAKHLVAAAMVLEDDSDLALAHAEHAARRAGRVAAVREALGLVHYRRGEFNDAIREFRTAKRLSGSNHLLPYLVDCERGLGRYERALDLAASPEARTLGEADNIELAIVVSGVRRDLNQPEAAQMVLRIPALERASKQPWAARLFYAYAEALLAAGAEAEARDWFAKAIDADVDGQTDAGERVDDLDGLVLIDALEEDEDDSDASAPAGPGDHEDLFAVPPEQDRTPVERNVVDPASAGGVSETVTFTDGRAHEEP